MCIVIVIFFFKQKTAYEMRISDWSSDVCSSDLGSKCSGGYPGKSFQVALQRIGISEMNIKLLIFNPLRTENRSLVSQRLNLIKIQYLPILVCNTRNILETGTHSQKTLLEIIIHQGIQSVHFFIVFLNIFHFIGHHLLP